MCSTKKIMNDSVEPYPYFKLVITSLGRLHSRRKHLYARQYWNVGMLFGLPSSVT